MNSNLSIIERDGVKVELVQSKPEPVSMHLQYILARSVLLNLDTEQLTRMKMMAEMIANSSLAINKNGSNKLTAGDAFIIMLKGLELGMDFMAAIDSIDLISGKPALDPQGMLALIHRSGQLESITIDATDERCVCTMTRLGKPAHSETFGIPEATRYRTSAWVDGKKIEIPLIEKDNYKSQPRTMFKWRAVAACARIVFPDVLQGLYTQEELGADVTVSDDGRMQIIRNTPAPSPKAQSTRNLPQPNLVPQESEQATVDTVDTVEKPAETPPDLPTPEETPKLRWVNKDRFARVKRDVTQLTGDWESIVPTLVREKGITNIDDMMQWDKAFETGKAAWDYVEQAFTALLAATPPAAPKAPTYGKTTVPQSPPKFEWTADRIGAMDTFVRASYWDKELEGAMSPDKLLVMTGVPGAAWSGFTDMEEAKAMIKTTAIKHGVSIIAHYAQYEGQYSELGNDQFTVRLYGRDKIRAVSPDWQAYVDSWQKGQRYTFADKGNLIVHWQPNKDGFPQATDIQPTDIPF